MCGSIVDIQSATADIRRGIKKEERKKEETTWQKYNVLPYYIRQPSETTGRKYNGLLYYIGRP